MALRRFTTAVDGSIPIPALLYNDEDLLGSQDGVGIYDGLQKAVNHQSGTLHVSSHRLFFVNSQQPISQSFSLDLTRITRTDHYAGLFMSSPKVTLYLDSTFVPPSGYQDGVNDGFESWICDVCNHRNPPGLSPAAARICALCGVPRSALLDLPQPNAPTLPPLQRATSLSIPVALSTPPGSSAPPSTRGPSPIACTACTFLNHPSLRVCEICSTPLLLAPGNAGINSKSAPSSRPASPFIEDNISDPANPIIKLSFRRGGDRIFYTTLRRALKARAWEGRQIGKGYKTGTSSGAISPEGSSTPGPLRRTGIDGILRNVETSAQNTVTQLSDAFQDLEALMVKAQDLVHLAAELNEKLGGPRNGSNRSSVTPSQAWMSSALGPPASPSPSLFTMPNLELSSDPEEAKFIRSSLAQLGMQLSNAPVTADMIQDEKTWMEELGRELASVLQGSNEPEQKTGGIMKERGVIGLDEVWGGWNRARGVALIPPATFLQTLEYLPFHTFPPIRSRTFNSGLRVLHTPPYSHAAFAARLSSHLMISGTRTASQLAREEGITVSLATEMILAVEADGVICRDDELSAIKGGGSGGSELRWSLNYFEEYIWDGEDG